MNAGTGSINVTGISGTVQAAYLYWHYIDRTSASPTPNGNVTFNGTGITGTSVGATGTNCWGTGRSFTMLAEVTSLVTSNGTYTLSGFPGPNATTNRSTNGVSLIIIYNDGNNTNNRDIYIFHGNDANYAEAAPGDTEGWNSTLSNINWNGTGTPTIELHVADGQGMATDGGLFFNGTQIVAPGTELWNGSSVPSAGSSRSTAGSLWDIKSFNLGPPYFVSGNNNLTVTDQLNANDCYALAVAVVSVPAEPPYNFSFYQDPILLVPSQMSFIRATAGSDVYIRFSLDGYQGADPYSSPPVSQRISCFDKSPIGPVQPIQRYPGDPFYNSFYDYYTTIWRTNPAWAGTCRRVTLFLDD